MPAERRHPIVESGILMPVLACLTLGLAPYFPEPHLIGKLRWIAGGAEGMASGDWFDVALHGAPWIWLVVKAVAFGRRYFSPSA